MEDEIVRFYENSTEDEFYEIIENARIGNKLNRNDITTIFFTNFYNKYFEIVDYWKKKKEIDCTLIIEVDKYIDMFREYSKFRKKSFGMNGSFHMMMKSNEIEENYIHSFLNFEFVKSEYIFITCADRKYIDVFLEQFSKNIIDSGYNEYTVYVACPDHDYEECNKILGTCKNNIILCPIKIDDRIKCYNTHSHYSSLRIFLLNEYLKKMSENSETCLPKIIMCDLDSKFNKDSVQLIDEIFNNNFDLCFKTWQISRPWQICAMGIVLVKYRKSTCEFLDYWVRCLSFWFKNLGYFRWGDQLTFENTIRQIMPEVYIGEETNKKLSKIITFYNGSIENKIQQI